MYFYVLNEWIKILRIFILSCQSTNCGVLLSYKLIGENSVSVLSLPCLSEGIALFVECFPCDLQKPDLAGLAEFLKPLNETSLKANTLTAGRRSEFFNHLKTVADALSALAWIAYTGKDCGMEIILVISSPLEIEMCSFTSSLLILV